MNNIRTLILAGLLAWPTTTLADKPPKPIKKPATAWKIGAVGLSKITDEQVAAGLTAALADKGYQVGEVNASTACVWEGRFTTVSKGDEKYEVYFKRPWARPDEACEPKDARGPGDDAFDDTVTRVYDPKAEVVLWVAPSFGLHGKQETPEQRARMIAEAKVLFEVVFKR